MATGGNTRAIVAAFLANLGIAIAKFVGFLVTSSASMLAESIHSLADTGNQGLLLLGGKKASRAATRAHQFGYGRERYFWAFVVSLVLFSVGGLFSLFDGYGKVRNPHELESPEWAIGILLFAVLAEGFSLRTAVKEANKVRGRASWPQWIRGSKSPELPVVVMEDLGALLGLFFALGAISIAVVTDNAVWDGVGSMSIGLLLVSIAIVLAVEMKSLLIGESASPEAMDGIVRAIQGADDVVDLIDLKTQHLSPEQLLVTAKVEFDTALTVDALADAIDGVEARIRQDLPEAMIYIEHDLRHDPSKS